MKSFIVAQRLTSIHFETVQAETPEAARAMVVDSLGGQLFTDNASQARLQDDGPMVVVALAHGESADSAVHALLQG